ncbi:MAG: hypothetical protein ACR2K3_00505 [Nocardioides sp.]
MKATRLLFAVPGVLVGLYGAYLLLGLGLGNLWQTLKWTIGGVVAHDLLLAPLVIPVWAVVSRILPARARRPLLVAGLIVGTVTITAIPVLGRYGAKPDNPTLLDRNYTAGWFVFFGLVAVATALALWWDARGSRRRLSGDDPGGR